MSLLRAPLAGIVLATACGGEPSGLVVGNRLHIEGTISHFLDCAAAAASAVPEPECAGRSDVIAGGVSYVTAAFEVTGSYQDSTPGRETGTTYLRGEGELRMAPCPTVGECEPTHLSVALMELARVEQHCDGSTQFTCGDFVGERVLYWLTVLRPTYAPLFYGIVDRAQDRMPLSMTLRLPASFGRFSEVAWRVERQ